jgi:ATP-dependent Clp protease ATP-binding subunit ClpC
VKISDEALEAAAKLSHRYITDRFLPDKAIDLIDEAASRVRLKTLTTPPELKEVEEELEGIRKEKDAAIKAQEFEKAASLRDKEQETKAKLEQLKQEWQKDHKLDNTTVTEEDIAEIVASWTGIPVQRLAEEESERLLNMEKILHNRVIGQEEAVVAISRAIRRAYAGLKDPSRPIGSFIFLGPTGVGKTELARALADAMFGDENAMIRLDMSEYMERFAVSRMVGAPPGYVGYEEGGELTEKVRRRPYSVVLFDEIEKAHPDVFNILLQILEDGRLTDAKGRTVDFRNTILIMTSNVGANLIQRQKVLGFEPVKDEEQDYADMKERVLSELKRTFRPEFLNRIDEIIVFHALNEEHIRSIVSLMVNEVNDRLTEQGIIIEVTDKAKDLLAKEGFDPMFGARPLRRVIQKRIEDRLSEELLKGNIATGDTVVIDAKEDDLTFNKKESAEVPGN